ncbi:Krr1-domain-containing protein [Xylariaceae sp. FL0016]|nr:Krr1-domain-containing protein [Xylariaceae sp. FL0016]
MAATAKTRQNALFDDTDDESDGGAQLKINDEYAKRFEHNKKREELHRLEEKFKSEKTNRDDAKDGDGPGSDSDSSDETEDEEGFLATEELDAQITATIQAIKNKDPRLYDGKTTFYTPVEEGADATAVSREKKEKPVYLQDYHREQLLRGDIGADGDDEKPSPTYAEEQESLKKNIQAEIKAQLNGDYGNDEDEEEDDFIKAKEETRYVPVNGMHPSRAAQVQTSKVKSTKPKLEDADKNPELFLSNYLSSRAWKAEGGSSWAAFESDEGEDEKAEEWETAYNLRFEDPSKSNEVLRSYARDVVAQRSVRRDDKSGRKRKRDLEREKKDAEKQERREERARLRKLKLEEAESKLQKIKEAAGIQGKHLKDEEWQRFLDDAWENDKWEEEMKKTFNDQYYAEAEGASDIEDAVGNSTKKPKKPKWDDDIDIKDLVPDFDEEDDRPKFTLTEDEAEDPDDDDEDAPSAKRQKTAKGRKKEKLATQKAARQERAKLEALVDKHMDIDEPEILGDGPSKASGVPKFAYRETRPESFGLTTRDILMASDADLNTYAGLKKLAHFRDPEKQAKDRKKLGKKARLRQWRKETFGPEFEREPPAFNPGTIEDRRKIIEDKDDANVIEGESKKKRKRSKRKGKVAAEVEV